MKKVLAWAVALALVLSSFTMAFAADTKTSADFKDASSINYTEAVDVMVATGIINGYPDGTFGPAKTVKRSEMAKMIAVMKNGGEDVGDTFKDSCTFADSKSHWAAGYIAYCASEHIIDGRSADVFDPEAEVTGTEVAKMALTSLGYDSKIQGYTGEDWAANVLKDAKKIELFDGLASDFVPGDPCTREAAAQILFNTLKGTEVEYENGTSVSVGDDVNVVVSSKVQDQTWPQGSKKDDNNNGTKELYEDVFGGDLSKASTTDNGKPAHKWTYNKDDVGTYPDSADANATADDNQAVADYLKDYNKDATVAVTVDATTGDRTTEIYLNGDNAPNAEIKKGDSVELFETDVDNAYRVVIMRYVADRIEEVNTDVKASDAEDGILAYVTFEKNGQYKPGSENKDIVGYNASTYEADAVVALALNSNKDIVDSYVIEKKATGAWSKDYTEKMTVDGTSYDKIGAGTADVAIFDNAKSGDDVDLYLINDYAAAVVKVSEDEADTVYGILLATGWADMSDGNGKAKILDAKGSVATYEVNEIPTGFDPDIGDVVAYSVNEDGTIDFAGDYYESATGVVALDKDSMSSKGLMKGYEVLETVAIFDYSGEDTTQKELQKADNYTVFGYSDLSGAEVTGFAVLNKDGDIAAIYTTAGLTSTETETFVAIFGSYKDASSGEDPIYDVKLYMNGESKNYDTADNTVNVDFQDGNVVVVTLNADGDIKKIESADAFESETVVSEFKDTYDYVSFKNSGEVTAKDGNKLTFGTYTINIEGAAIYKWKEGKIDADNYTKSEITAATGTPGEAGYVPGDSVYVYQFSDGSDTWDVVVIGAPLTTAGI